MTRVDLKGVHRVRAASGREYHYAWRGGPRFWSSDSGFPAGSAEYLAALAASAPKARSAQGLFRSLIIAWLESGAFAALAPRSQKDFRTSLSHPKNGIDAKFGAAPIAAFDDPRIRRQVIDWRDCIGGKVGHDRLRHLQRIVAWALDRGDLHHHYLREIATTYRANRADVIWTPAEVQTFVAGAPSHIARILTAATETGLRPGDLAILSREHIHPTPNGQRIVIWTRKRRRLASIPVTPAMTTLIAATPAEQSRLLVTAEGTPWTHENYLGAAVSTWRDNLGLRSELRLYDARGTAATRLLSAGADLREIATHMGWSLKHAASVIDTYAALTPEATDGIAAKLARADRTRNKRVKTPVKK